MVSGLFIAILIEYLNSFISREKLINMIIYRLE